MKLHPLFAICCLVFAVNVALGQARHVTLTLDARGNQTPERAQVTNELAVAEFETAELVSSSSLQDFSVALFAVKDGLQIPAVVTPVAPGFTAYGLEFKRFVVSGPAKVRFVAPIGSGVHFTTFRVTPEAFPPDRTIIAMPGTNQTLVTLECSTNLVHWEPATNGVYGPMPEAKFFRIQAKPVH